MSILRLIIASTLRHGRVNAAVALGVIVSHDSGVSWNVTNFPVGALPISVGAVGSQYFIGTQVMNGHGVMTSVDKGDHWADANAGLPVDAQGASLVSVTGLGTHGTKLFAGTSKGVYVSSDKGGSWTAASNGLVDTSPMAQPTPVAYCFATSGNTVYVGTGFGVFSTSNDGATWAPLDRGDLPNFTAVYAMTTLGTKLFIGTYTDGVWAHAL